MSGEAPRLLSHDTVYLVGATAGEALRRAAVVADAILAADERCCLDHVLVRSDVEVGFDAMLNVFVPGPADERYLTSERLDEIAQAALDKLDADRPVDPQRPPPPPPPYRPTSVLDPRPS